MRYHQDQAAFDPLSRPENASFLAFENPMFNGPKPLERVSCPAISNVKKDMDEKSLGKSCFLICQC